MLDALFQPCLLHCEIFYKILKQHFRYIIELLDNSYLHLPVSRERMKDFVVWSSFPNSISKPRALFTISANCNMPLIVSMDFIKFLYSIHQNCQFRLNWVQKFPHGDFHSFLEFLGISTSRYTIKSLEVSE